MVPELVGVPQGMVLGLVVLELGLVVLEPGLEALEPVLGKEPAPVGKAPVEMEPGMEPVGKAPVEMEPGMEPGLGMVVTALGMEMGVAVPAGCSDLDPGKGSIGRPLLVVLGLLGFPEIPVVLVVRHFRVVLGLQERPCCHRCQGCQENQARLEFPGFLLLRVVPVVPWLRMSHPVQVAQHPRVFHLFQALLVGPAVPVALCLHFRHPFLVVRWAPCLPGGHPFPVVLRVQVVRRGTLCIHPQKWVELKV